jgi:hypothetical protein
MEAFVVPEFLELEEEIDELIDCTEDQLEDFHLQYLQIKLPPLTLARIRCC